MSLRVLKWDVSVDDRSHPIGVGRVLHVAIQYHPDQVQVWTLEDEMTLRSERHVQVFATGQPLPGSTTAHVGTAIAAGGALVWHVFEVIAPTTKENP